MTRAVLFLTLAACAADPAPASVSDAVAALSLDVTREQVDGDVYHYAFTLTVGDTPNARLRMHRVVREEAPFRPRRTRQAIMLLHGDFATFSSNFLPGMAPWLAAHDVDVFGFDRRWASAESDTSDFAAMGFARRWA